MLKPITNYYYLSVLVGKLLSDSLQLAFVVLSFCFPNIFPCQNTRDGQEQHNDLCVKFEAHICTFSDNVTIFEGTVIADNSIVFTFSSELQEYTMYLMSSILQRYHTQWSMCMQTHIYWGCLPPHHWAAGCGKARGFLPVSQVPAPRSAERWTAAPPLVGPVAVRMTENKVNLTHHNATLTSGPQVIIKPQTVNTRWM